MIQPADDLDFTQDVLTATGGNVEINPTLNAVLAGFARRKRSGRFNDGQLNLEFDRLRYASTVSAKDSDLQAKEVYLEDIIGKQPNSWKQQECKFFQRPSGCREGSRCGYVHRCILCEQKSHGASSCGTRAAPATGGTKESRTDRGRERPPNPRSRRDRANNTATA